MKALSELGGSVSHKDGNLIVTIPLKATPAASSTGKTLIVAGTSGAVETSLKLKVKAEDGTMSERGVILNLNAYVYAKEK